MPSPPAEPPAPLDAATQKTYERALNLLSFSARSARQLHERLLAKGEPAPQVEAVIARLCANGLLDDARFAEARARAGIDGQGALAPAHRGGSGAQGRRAGGGRRGRRAGARRGGHRRARRGVRAAEKKLRSLARVEPQVRRQKLYAFLARQGYAAEVVRRTLRAVLDAPPPDEADD